MRHSVWLLTAFLVGCPKPVTPPPQPPTEVTCNLEEADHDEAVDHVVTALQLQMPLDKWVTKYGRDAITCVVEEVAVEAHAPEVAARAKAWLVAHP